METRSIISSTTTNLRITKMTRALIIMNRMTHNNSRINKLIQHHMASSSSSISINITMLDIIRITKETVRMVTRSLTKTIRVGIKETNTDMGVNKDNFSSSNSTNNTLLGIQIIDRLNSSISNNSKVIMGTTKIDKDRTITTTAPTIKKKAGTKSSNSTVIISTNSNNITTISRMILSHTKVI
jgi:hypothetical protein